MGSSSSKSIACGTVNTHSSWHTGSAKGMVKVWSCRIPAALWLGVHHAIVVDVPSNGKWAVYEWGPDGGSFYACDKICGHRCCNLEGTHTLDEVYQAAREACDGKSYSKAYNCNHWTDRVAGKLGYNITCHWNCACVL